uniref:AMP-binding domain-containing protein n=1 Tax=Gongylonema pulchrum TaxID=637853 RepID=A0A183CXZ4_9BILA
LFSTTTTFDPFVVEIFLAAMNGAKILLVPDWYRSTPARLADAIIKHGATFLQTTPSQLKIFPHAALMEIFAGRTSVRTILVGGEAFPMNFLRGYHIDDKSVAFYNVYGITEVSCWASCQKISWKEDDVEIGEPLLGTKFLINEQGELLIGGTRRCISNGEWSGTWTSTGDIVERKESGKIYWLGRCNDQQKINGIKVSLTGLARKAETFDGIQSALALQYAQSVLLFVHVKNNSVQSELLKNISIAGLLFIVIPMESWPLTLNGKVDRQKLMQIFKQRDFVFTVNDLSDLLSKFGICLKNDRERTFAALGLTSLRATELTIKTEHLLKQRDFPLLQYFLSDTATVAGFLDLLKFGEVFWDAPLSCSQGYVIKPAISREIYPEWEYNLGKCIDATPVVESGSVFVGSHSGRFVSLSLDGAKNWEVEIGGRIEATACYQSGIIAVGCYSGCLYLIDGKNGQIIWQYQVGNAIKSRPVLFDDAEKCVFGSHDKFLYMLDIKEQKLLWKVACDGSILSSPLLHNDAVFVATLQGEFLAVDLVSFGIL